MDIGHTEYEGSYGCNYIWIYTKDKGFEFVPETSSQRSHYEVLRRNPDLRSFDGFNEKKLFQGRVDDCKKVASISGCNDCSGLSLASYPQKVKECSYHRSKLLESISKQFGNIKIMDLQSRHYEENEMGVL